jgi:invasion protein IalB
MQRRLVVLVSLTFVGLYDTSRTTHEGPAAAKAEQYRRWEKLCDLQKATDPECPTSCVGAKSETQLCRSSSAATASLLQSDSSVSNP